MTGVNRSGRSRTEKRVGRTGEASSSRSQSSLAPGAGSQSFDTVVEQMRSVEINRRTPAVPMERGADDALHDRPSGPSVGIHGTLDAARHAAAAPRAAGPRRRSVPSMLEGETLAPVASQPPTSGVAAPICLSGDEIKEKRRMDSLLTLVGMRFNAAKQDPGDEKLLDQVINAGSAALHHYKSLSPALARTIVDDNQLITCRYLVWDAVQEYSRLAEPTIHKLQKKKAEEEATGLTQSTATPESVVEAHAACVKWWEKKVGHCERGRAAWRATASLPSATAKMRQEEEATLRLATGSVMHSKLVYLQSRIDLARAKIEPQASTFDAPVREILMVENGRVRLLEAFSGDVLPAFLSTQNAVLSSGGHPLDADHCAVLEGVIERLSEFASELQVIRTNLNDHQTSADLPLELLSQIVEGAWIVGHEVMHLLELQPKPPAVALPPDAGAAIPAETAGKSRVAKGTLALQPKAPALIASPADAGATIQIDTVGKSPVAKGTLALQPNWPANIAPPADMGAGIPADTAGKAAVAGAAARRKRKGKGKPAVGAGSSAPGRASQVAAVDSDTAPADKVLVLSDMGTKLVSAEEARASASAGAQSAKQAPPSMEALTQERQVKPEDARYVAETVVERLQTQPAEMRACPAALDEPRRPGLLAPAQVPEVQDKTVRLKGMLNQAQELAKALNSQSSHAPGQSSQSSDAGVERTHSGPQDRMSYARVVRGADEALGDKSADYSIAPRGALAGSRGATSGPRHGSPQGRHGEAMGRQESSLRLERSWLGDQEPSRSQPDTLARHDQSQSRPVAGPERRRFDHVAAQSFDDALLNDALHKIFFAHDINEFSYAVVENDKRLQSQAHRATFLRKAASEFTRHFVPRWEDDVRAGNTWGFATSCNATSREPGGQAGMEACRAMAAQVSRLGRALNDVESKTLSLFVLSFSRHPRLAECRNGMITIAKLFHEQPGALSELNGQSLALLVNGFSKWPEQENARKATVAVAAEIRRRPAGLSDFDPQNLGNVVNGLSKWPLEEECCGVIDAIAGKVCGRAGEKAGLSGFNSQAFANLVNGFSKAREPGNSHQATIVIADAVCRLADEIVIADSIGRLADEKAGRTGWYPQALANLVNGFSKWPLDCRGAIVAIARQVAGGAGKLPVFDAQALANLVNGFSKWPEDCRGATIAIAAEVCRLADLPKAGLSGFDPQHLANLVNGFSKLQAAECSRATVAIAGEVCHRAGRRKGLSDFDVQHLANLVKGFSKWPQEVNLGYATNVVAGEVLRCAEPLSEFLPLHLASLVNGFSKWPRWENSHQATVAIAGEVRHRADQLSGFEPQELANLVNGFSKWPEDCRGAIVAIARAVPRRAGRLSGFNGQDLANLVNGFSKWPLDCREAMVAIARAVPRRAGRLSGFNGQDLANLVNGFSKWPQEENSRQATVAIAGEVLRSTNPPPDFSSQYLANLVNGFSKWPEEEALRQAAAAIAGEVIRSANRLPDFTSQHLANLVNGFSKWPQEEKSRQATAAIAGEVLRGAERLSGVNPQQLANLLNGFDRFAEEEACSQAILEIARRLGQAGQPFRHFAAPGLSSIANSLARGILRSEDAGEIAEAALLKDRLHKLAHYLHYASDRLEEADAVGVTSILKALAKAQLYDDLGSLAGAGLNRLAELHRAPGFAHESNLETMGNLCAALLPLARSPRKQLLWHRRPALNLLNDIQPIVEHKIEAHLRASDAERARGPYSTRCLALSIYQVLKARASLAGLLRRPYVEGNKPDLRARRDELQSKTKEILDSTRELVERDLSNMSWNLIAQIEAEGPTDALDTFMAQNAATVQAQNRASVFDVHQTLRAMDHEPRPPQGEAGLMRLPVVDMQGRQLATEAETRYSIFHRLTSGAVKMVAVQLPGKPSPFMLARTLTVEGVPYRMDLFGGSKLKPPPKTLSQVAARIPGRVEAASSGGKLLAIPYAETAPGTAFEQLSRSWAPFKEAYYYTQRRGFAAPPNLQGLGPRDYALEGAFKLSLLPDRPANQERPFKLIGPEGPIALRPYDGCGFIKASLATRMPAVRRTGRQEGPDRVPAFGEGRRSSLPASALQHYPRSEQVADEAHEKAKTWLESREGKELTAEELFRTVTVGHIDGPGAVAVPSADKCLHVPTLKSETLTGKSGVLIGRSPYDKPNLRPFSADLVKSAVDGDPTAAFLDTCVAIQYSFNVAQKSGEELAADDPTFFAKGILIVVPDEMWPAAHADRGLVLSAEDVKSHSHWTTGKDRVKEDTPLDCLGILQATEVFAPGSLVAVPTGEQKKLDGDFDGDTVIIIGDRPQLYEHVREFDEKEQALGLPSLKPPKSHTPALDGDKYQFGRASQILAATQDVLETYSGLQRNFLAQSHEARGWFAERAIFGTYEGVHHELRRDIGQLLGREEEVSGQDIETVFARARREIEVARHPVAREMAALLVADLEAWAQKPERLPETVGPVNDAKSTTLSAAVSELLPDLADAYPVTNQPRDRIRALIDNYPARIDPRPDGYNPDDLVQSANNLLSLGIKVGTDAYKSNTGARLFSRKSQDLQRLLHTTPGLRSVPYVKGLAASLNHGRFDVDAALKDLEDNPTLTASVMETSINLAAEHGILRSPSGLRPTAEAAEMIPLTPEEASERARIEVARATKEEGKITAAALSVAASLRKMEIQVKMPHLERRLRSERSIREQLTGTSISSGSTPQLISSAVRHVFEIPDNDFTRAFKAAILAFEEQHYTEIEVTNWFKFERPSYLGIHTVLATTEGYRFQVEFHTPASYSAKVDNHDAYKEMQELKRRDALQKAEKLEQKVREGNKAVDRPDNVLSIAHWRDGKDSAAAAPGLRAVGRSTESEIAKSPEAKETVAALGHRPVVLVGMPSAGKTTIGAPLAKRLGLRFIDTDQEIQKQTGKSITQIFNTNGEGYFRKLEAEAIARVLEQGPAVIATGGGSLNDEQTRRLIADKAVSIWINTDPRVLRRRLRNDTTRPLLRGSDRDQTVPQLMDERKPFYEQANVRFVPPRKNDKQNAGPCLKALHAYLCPTGADAQSLSNISHGTVKLSAD
ncbi:shikimate kinase [Mesorhizobium sp. L-8-10]|uniref:shikimate kinase n=1 Tax=Mesorhizobium sp. L-8-10 TaxID=2744523 RepID=UPI0019281BA3|nr:shikimate kinase [Mesorhizobium sp. L-8-10]